MLRFDKHRTIQRGSKQSQIFIKTSGVSGSETSHGAHAAFPSKARGGMRHAARCSAHIKTVWWTKKHAIRDIRGGGCIQRKERDFLCEALHPPPRKQPLVTFPSLEEPSSQAGHPSCLGPSGKSRYSGSDTPPGISSRAASPFPGEGRSRPHPR